MTAWFNRNLERNNLRKYSERHLLPQRTKGGNWGNFFRKLSITNWFILINILFFILIALLISLNIFTEEKIFSFFALRAISLFDGALWTLLTSMFSHRWLPDLFFNIISLFFVGNLLEKIIGRKKYFWFYICAGLFAGLFYAVLSFYFGRNEIGAKIFVDPELYSLGASGAIFGIAGLLAVLTPLMKVYLVAGPIIALVIQSVIGSVFPNSSINSISNLIITIYIFISIFSLFSFNPTLRKISLPLGMPFWIMPLVAIVPLIIIGLFVPLPIGNTAHLGGLIAGAVYGVYLKNKYRKKTDYIRNYFRGG